MTHLFTNTPLGPPVVALIAWGLLLAWQVGMPLETAGVEKTFRRPPRQSGGTWAEGRHYQRGSIVPFFLFVVIAPLVLATVGDAILQQQGTHAFLIDGMTAAGLAWTRGLEVLWQVVWHPITNAAPFARGLFRWVTSSGFWLSPAVGVMVCSPVILRTALTAREYALAAALTAAGLGVAHGLLVAAGIGIDGAQAMVDQLLGAPLAIPSRLIALVF